MPEHLDPSAAHSDPATESPSSQDALRLLSRSPHPYRRQKFELPDTVRTTSLDIRPLPSRFPKFADSSREPTPSSDSGTEADDEHFLKGLPAPRRLHKGLRGRNEVLSGASTPISSPAFLEAEGRKFSYGLKKDAASAKDSRVPAATSGSRRKREIIRRLTEFLIIAFLGIIVYTNPGVRLLWRNWSQELRVGVVLLASLLLLYPLRLVVWAYWHRTPSRKLPISIPTSFDPAPLFYPPTITLFVSSLVAVDIEAALLPNIILALCSLPPALTLASSSDQGCNPLHWALSCVPLFLSSYGGPRGDSSGGGASIPAIPTETLALLYPLHYNLLLVLHTLTTTSLLTAELQLLSVALINIFLLSSSPQAIILKVMLWVGGLDILVTCSQTIMWGIALARVPKWRFRRSPGLAKRNSTFLSSLMSWRRVRHDLFHLPMDSSSCSSCEANDDLEDSDDLGAGPQRNHVHIKTITFDGASSTDIEGKSFTNIDAAQGRPFRASESQRGSVPQRRHTLPSSGKPLRKSNTHTPSGRRKRSASSSVRAFFSLTQEQATFRKWIYAVYVYVCIMCAVFVPLPMIGVKEVVMSEALHGYEPVGWALGYLFGDLPWFRWQVIIHDLERWICLPPRSIDGQDDIPLDSWVERLRRYHIGEANTRLILSAHCITIIFIGLVVVFRLSPIYEVDTRRKVFHFMMVAMFLPTTYIDPTFASLALSIILALFLLLDLLRASQLPPLSKPLASFLAPYVDGRDLRGPVVISHMFLLIGCAIPLWLSLGSLPRTGTGSMEGWGVPTREVGMVSGVVCVGLGDAAASLIGRRYGHRKWLWGGGKSLEGSIAFATAVLLGLMAAHGWLRVGGWPATNGKSDPWGITLQKAGACAGVASLTEAVLTGGNDNVIVPVILWTCVKGIGV
ncbi:hypothetical protein F4809DRAFT_256219 [Biscogniauxia mediterranea]|nr:hypothetical protein F4809DRAFT_256219 [Biscogniauxia mediterranea]